MRTGPKAKKKFQRSYLQSTSGDIPARRKNDSVKRATGEISEEAQCKIQTRETVMSAKTFLRGCSYLFSPYIIFPPQWLNIAIPSRSVEMKMRKEACGHDVILSL